jgi:uracil-DNA glycosylase
MTPEARDAAFRALAGGLDRLDREAYAEAGADPRAPVLGEGDPHCRIALFGRDPGRDEVRHGEPFIGAGGQAVRRVLHEVVEGGPPPDAAAARTIGRVAFWANTVPYKPLGNKAWSVRTRRAFQPLVADLLIHGWRGRDVLCLGRNAFTWFGLMADRDARQQLEAAWKAEPRFVGPPVDLDLAAPDGATRPLRLWPLPHPSPLNATWHRRFPDLLRARLAAVGFGRDTWRLDGAPTRS